MKFIFCIFLIMGTACDRGHDAYSQKIVMLANQAEKNFGPSKIIEDQVENLRANSQQQTYESSEDADTALRLYEKYPDNPDEAYQINKMIADGVPSDADSSTILEARSRSLKVRVSGLLSLNRKLLNSAEKFKWPREKAKKIGLIALERALRHVDRPTTHIELMVDLVQLKVAADRGVLKSTPELKAKLEGLSARGRAIGAALNAAYSKRSLRLLLLNATQNEKIWQKLPSFFVRPWVDLAAREIQEDATFGQELRPVYNELAEINLLESVRKSSR